MRSASEAYMNLPIGELEFSACYDKPWSYEGVGF